MASIEDYMVDAAAGGYRTRIPKLKASATLAEVVKEALVRLASAHPALAGAENDVASYQVACDGPGQLMIASGLDELGDFIDESQAASAEGQMLQVTFKTPRPQVDIQVRRRPGRASLGGSSAGLAAPASAPPAKAAAGAPAPLLLSSAPQSGDGSGGDQDESMGLPASTAPAQAADAASSAPAPGPAPAPAPIAAAPAFIAAAPAPIAAAPAFIAAAPAPIAAAPAPIAAAPNASAPGAPAPAPEALYTLAIHLREDDALLATLPGVSSNTTCEALLAKIATIPAIASVLAQAGDTCAALLACYTGHCATAGSGLSILKAFELDKVSALPLPSPLPLTLVLYPRAAMRSLHPLSAEDASEQDSKAGDAELRVIVIRDTPDGRSRETDVQTIKVDSKTDTVANLKRKLFHSRQVPVERQALFLKGMRSLGDSLRVEELIGGADIVLEELGSAAPQGYMGAAQASFYAGQLNTTTPQTTKGIACFFCSLRMLHALYNASEVQQDLLGRFLLLTRCTPAVNVLRRIIMNDAPVSRAELLVLMDACYALFRRVVPTQPAFCPTTARVEDSCVFEHANLCFAFVCGTVADGDGDLLELRDGEHLPSVEVPMEEFDDEEEEFDDDEEEGSGSAKKKKPAVAALPKDFVSEHDVVLVPVPSARPFQKDDYLVMCALPEKAREEEEPPPALSAAAAAKLAAVMKASGGTAAAADGAAASASSSSSAAATADASAVDGPLAGCPSDGLSPAEVAQRYFKAPIEKHDKDSWSRLRELLEGLQRLSFVSATRLKDSLLEKPGMTFNWLQGGTPCVYDAALQMSGESVAETKLYSPLTGARFGVDVDKLIAAQGDQHSLAVAGAKSSFTRAAREAVIVLLDVSGSMAEPAFPKDNAAYVAAAAASSAAAASIGSAPVANVGLYSGAAVAQAALGGVGRGATMTRLDACVNFFHAFSNRSASYDLRSVVGLIAFHNSPQVKSPITESWGRFVKALDEAEAGGGTALWDAMRVAKDLLLKFQKEEGATAADCKLRILCLTDGYDLHSVAKCPEVIRELQTAGICVDAVVVGGEADRRLAAVTRSTHGGFFAPPSMVEAMSLFEDETFLCWHERSLTAEQRSPAVPQGPIMTENAVLALAAGVQPSVLGQGIFRRPQLAALSKKGVSSYAALKRMHADLAAPASSASSSAAAAALPAAGSAGTRGAGTMSLRSRQSLKAPAALSVAAESPAATGSSSTGSAKKAAGPAAEAAAAAAAAPAHSTLYLRRAQRVMAELKNMVTSPMQDFQCFPCPDDLYTWRVVMRAPDGCPYSGASFELSIVFPDAYPTAPPQIRFLDPIVHCNINSNGKVCHSILDRNYLSSFRVSDLLVNVQQLMVDPEPADPIDSVLGELCRTDKAAYEAKAKAAAEPFKQISYHDKARQIGGDASGETGAAASSSPSSTAATASAAPSSSAPPSASPAVVASGGVKKGGRRSSAGTAATTPSTVAAAGQKRGRGAGAAGEAGEEGADASGHKRGRGAGDSDEDGMAAAPFFSPAAASGSKAASAASSSSSEAAALTCSKTGCLYIDPVKTPEGYTYERSWLADWLLRYNGMSPVGGTPLKMDQVVRMDELRERADAFRKKLVEGL